MAPIADRWSKKWWLIFGLSTILIDYVLIVASTSLKLIMVYVFVYGFGLSIVIISGLLLILHMIPKINWSFVVLLFLACSVCVSFYVAAYFRYFTKSWKPLIESACIFLLIFIIFLCFINENIGHLFNQERYEELDETLRAIAKTNKITF
jgi:MFS family permease